MPKKSILQVDDEDIIETSLARASIRKKLPARLSEIGIIPDPTEFISERVCRIIPESAPRQDGRSFFVNSRPVL